MHEPNTIKVAVTAAGGRLKAAAALGVDPWQISYWQRSGRIPPAMIRPLAELTRGLVSVDAILAYVERVAPVARAA